ncbi:MAG TPA: DUF2975 domain-containing protein [bacterium]|nr:DUF2975 domain-containing protein [bacterium]
MKRFPTYFLRFFILVLFALSLVFAVFAFPGMWQGSAQEFPGTFAVYAIRLIMVGLYATLPPFYWVLWNAFKFLNYIDKNQALSEGALKTLKNIKYGAGVIAVLYVGGMPLLLPIAEADDAPGILLFGAAIACMPIAVACLAAVLERVLGEK